MNDQKKKQYQMPDYSRFRHDASLEDLLAELGVLGNVPVFLYTMTTVHVKDGNFRQAGSGPNLEGGVATLCTCKHDMRASRHLQPGAVIAGFASRGVGLPERNALFYLGQVNQLFDTHAELWDSLPVETARLKSVSENRLGDVFEPAPGPPRALPIEYEFYLPVRAGKHSHRRDDEDETRLRADVHFQRANRGPARLLAFSPDLIWTWTTPRVVRAATVGRGYRRDMLHSFIKSLEKGVTSL